MVNEKKTEKTKTKSIKTTLIAMSVAPLVILAVVIIFVARSAISTGIQDEVQSGLQVACTAVYAGYDDMEDGNYYLNEAGEMMTGDFNITQGTHVLDDFTEGTEIDATIFWGDTRTVSTIKDENGNYIVGTKASEEVTEAVLRKGENYSTSDVVINGEAYYGYYMPMQNDSDKTIVGMVFAGTPRARVDNMVWQKSMNMSVIAVIGTLLVVVICFRVSSMLSGAIKKTQEVVQVVASGDLTQDVDPVVLERKDELGAMGRSMEELLNELRESVSSIQESAKQVLTAGDELGETAEQTSHTTDEISCAVDDISKGAVSQAEDIENATGRVAEMGGLIEQIVEHIKELNESSASMQKTSEESSVIMKELGESNDKTVAAIQKVAENVKATDQSVQKISDAVELINNIASQTSLLALNASIEAARAGDAGRGFAVVASEIQKLSVESSESTQTITEIIGMLSEDSKKTMEVMNEVNERLAAQQKTLDETKAKFETLNSDIILSREGTSRIHSQAKGCDEARSRVVDIIQDLSAISEENAASTEETNASMEELNATINLLAESATALKNLAVKMDENTRFFHLT